MDSLRKLYMLVSIVAGVMSSSAAFTQIQSGSLQGQSMLARNQALIALPSAQNSATSGRAVNLRFPQGTRPETVKAVLNGKDVSARFQEKTCSGSVCLSGILTETDGIRDGKNVLYATARNEDGTASSSRMHFEGAQPKQKTSGMRTLVSASTTPAASATGLPTASSFLPPSISFTTLTPGGAPTNGNWIQLGSQIQLSIGDCASVYSVIVLDRQTLQQQTGAPEISPRCFPDRITLATYLQSLTGLNDLVVVGTNQGQQTDAANISPDGSNPFDTTAIGGTAYFPGFSGTPSPGFSLDSPVQYMAIGVPGAEPGSAYESYTTATSSNFSAAATGMVVEDASGNYNFQPSGNVEYMVQPGATAADAYIQINNTPTGPQYNVRYWPPSASNSTNGFWLLVLDRHTLLPVTACPQDAPNGNLIIVPNCGQYFPTGAGAGQNVSDIANLGPALSAVTSSQIAVLTTVGTAGWAPANQMAGTGPSYYNDNGTLELAIALQTYGIPDKLILETGAPGSTYTMIGVPGLGGPLNGHNVLSTNYLSQQGQTGYVHGTFALDNHGMFEPAHGQQEPGLNATTGTTTDTANLQLGLVLSQQPVEWPELTDQPQLLAGALSLSGQIDAYKYLSWYLLNTWYIQGLSGYGYPLDQGVTGPYSYDIHYFYTGSLNTAIDYHTFDPLNATFPAPTSACSCTWENPNDGTQLTFTQNDFNAVQVQLHNEIVALTNVLSFFVTGSTNLKDIVAAGNSNVALALLQGFSAVEANINQQGVALAQKTPVKVSPWHIVNMIATDVSPYVSLLTDGAVSPGDIKLADQTIGFIGDAFKAAGGTGGGLASGHQSSTADIPRLDYSLDTTVSQLAGLGLQGQFLAGFDATLDSITGDWNKLITLGASAVNNQALYSPTQATQNTAIAQITTAEQKSLYMSLVPSVFQVHFWNMTSGASTVADMGYTKNDDVNTCNAFYPGITAPPSGTTAPNASLNYPTYGGITFQQYWTGGTFGYPFQYSEDPQYQDWYVLALPFINAGHSNATAQVMNSTLAGILFANGPGDVNLSMDEFVAKNGPLDQLLTGGKSQFLGFANVYASNPPYSPVTNAIGLANSNICSQSEVNTNAPVEGSPTPDPPPASATVTTLQAPASAVLGVNVLLQANVMIQSSSSPAGGSVQFRDGSTTLQTVTLDATGSATYTTNTLALGQHALSASFASTDGSLPSDSNPQTTTIYANSPDMQLTLSQASLNVGYGMTSSPTSLQVQALSGMSGTVNYACTGLPVGMTCAFTPTSSAITDGGTATTSFTVTGNAPTTSSFAAGKGWGLFLFAVPLLLLRNIRRGRAKLASAIFPLLLLALAIGSAIGCGGSSNSTLKETGSKTVLISATCGTLTKTTPLIVNIQ